MTSIYNKHIIISSLEEQIGKLKKFIEKSELLGKSKEFLKSLEPVSMAERIGAARKESEELERARKAEKVITKKSIGKRVYNMHAVKKIKIQLFFSTVWI